MKSRFVTYILSALLALYSTSLFAQNNVTVTDDIDGEVTWTADNTYFLNGLIFVNPGATLTIEPGTVIKGLENANITSGDGAAALIVRRDGTLIADGTAQEPIIFTSELDDVSVADDLVDENGIPDRGLWGGLILLGNAPTNQTETLTQIEGVPVEEEAAYGGDDPNDSSGIVRYVSIRHGGFSISGVEGDEINGLTLGAVGAGTIIEHVEVFANFDDCYEWFGGTVNSKYLVGAFCGDDTFDYDQGYRGYGQFWFAIQAADVAGRGGEHDGCDPEDGACDDAAFSQAIVSNATYIGSGSDNTTVGGDGNDLALRLRENVGSKYFNSVFTAYADRFVRIDEGDSDPDAVDRFLAGDLELKNNIVWDFGHGPTWDDLVRTSDADKPAIVAAISAGNELADPMLAGISRDLGGMALDPRPNAGSPALTGADFGGPLAKTSHEFFTPVEYRGAFGSKNWALGWTALDALGYFGDFTTVATEDDVAPEVPASITLNQNYPNPFNPATTISFSLKERTDVRLTVHDLLGREAVVLVDGAAAAGEHAVRFDAAGLPSGIYVYRLEAAGKSLSNKMLLLK